MVETDRKLDGWNVRQYSSMLIEHWNITLLYLRRYHHTKLLTFTLNHFLNISPNKISLPLFLQVTTALNEQIATELIRIGANFARVDAVSGTQMLLTRPKHGKFANAIRLLF